MLFRSSTFGQAAEDPSPFYVLSASSSSAAVNGGTTPASVTMPTGVRSGDIAFFIVSWGAVATLTTTPSGWTQLGTTQSYTTGETAVFYKTLAGTEGGTAYTATSGAANYWAAAIVVYRNTSGIDQNGGDRKSTRLNSSH